MRMKRIFALIMAMLTAAMLWAGALAETYPKLRPGDSGSDVRRMQQALIEQGYLSGKADGKFGTRTENAVRSFQRKNGLTVDGIAGSATLALLYAGKASSGGQTAPQQTKTAAAGWFGGNYGKIVPGDSGRRVQLLQAALRKLGRYTGLIDGKYGPGTRDAVSDFQRGAGLTRDGKAGKQTLLAIEGRLGAENTSDAAARALAGGQSAPAATAKPTAAPAPTATPKPASSSMPGKPERTLGKGDSGSDVRSLQSRLAQLGYFRGTNDGVYGNLTQSAVTAFQRQCGLYADGIAGPKTLSRLYASSAPAAGQTAAAQQTPAQQTAAQTVSQPVSSSSGPSVSEVRLLHWFNEVKPTLRSGQKLLVYDPATGLSWTLRILSLGRYCDAEPLTLQDTQTMVRSFGNKNTWDQRAVFVRLPSGVWVLGSTHDMPHLSGSVKDNGFDGHLCVHFLRDMEECKKNDPKYGVANQNTIRAKWKQMTGIEVK